MPDLIVTVGADGITRMRLNRPHRMNAYTSELCQLLVRALADFAADDTQRVAVLTGAERAFCSGGDVKSDIELNEGHEREFGHALVMRENMHRVILAIWESDKPIIAAVNGPAISGGLALAAACTYRVAAESARFGDASVRLGLLPDEGGMWLFPSLMGLSAARRMMLASEIYDAHQAINAGLVDEVVADDLLAARADDLAAAFASAAPLSARCVMSMSRRGQTSDLRQSLGDVELGVLIVNPSHDATEGVAAFTERRSPRFVGR